MLKILVIDSGWVLVGRIQESDEREVLLSPTSCVRVWGTTKGLGEIALCGPTKATQLDPMGKVVVMRESIKFMIDCVEDPWAKHIS